MRAREHQPDALCILTTAYPTAGLQDAASRMGIHEFLPKPLTIPKLEKALELLITRLSVPACGRV
jgi:DNA-binding NtrC family response regulator